MECSLSLYGRVAARLLRVGCSRRQWRSQDTVHLLPTWRLIQNRSSFQIVTVRRSDLLSRSISPQDTSALTEQIPEYALRSFRASNHRPRSALALHQHHKTAAYAKDPPEPSFPFLTLLIPCAIVSVQLISIDGQCLHVRKCRLVQIIVEVQSVFLTCGHMRDMRPEGPAHVDEDFSHEVIVPKIE